MHTTVYPVYLVIRCFARFRDYVAARDGSELTIALSQREDKTYPPVSTSTRDERESRRTGISRRSRCAIVKNVKDGEIRHFCRER